MFRHKLRRLVTQFHIRDLIWLTLVVASLAAWWRTKRENAALREESFAKSEALAIKARALETAAKKEANLRREVELLGQATRSLGAGLAKRDVELRESLERREEVINALRILKESPGPS